MKDKEFDLELGRKLKDIREKHTDLNQEDFFEKHLKGISSRNLNTKASYQDYMKKLENGSMPCPPLFLPTYAKIAGISVDELFGKENNLAEQDRALPIPTYESIIKTLNQLVNVGSISVDHFLEENYYSPDASSVKASISILDPVLAYTFERIRKMKNLLKDRTIDAEMYYDWKESFYRKIDYRLLRMNDDEFEIFLQCLDKITLEPSDDSSYLSRFFEPYTLIDAMKTTIKQSGFLPYWD